MTSLDTFCGSKFWDANLTWHTDVPAFTPCFERTVLVWAPCGYLWLWAPLETRRLLLATDRQVPWTWLNISKLIISTLLLIVQSIDLIYAVYQSLEGEIMYGVDFTAPAILLISIFLQLVFVLAGKSRGVQSSGHLFIFWLLMVLCAVPEFASRLAGLKEEDTDINFYTYMVHFPLIALMFLLGFFADATPKYLNFPRGHKPCPETSASFPSKMTFSWMDKLIWNGYRKPLKEEKLWNLSEENSSVTIVGRWKKYWAKAMRKAYEQAGHRSAAKYSTHGGKGDGATEDAMDPSVEVRGGMTSGKPQVSIMPILIYTCGAPFLVGALQKLVCDILMFVKPQLLRYLIQFIERGEEEGGGEWEEPFWQGLLYAVLLFVASQAESVFLSQYFARMYVVGLQVRSAVMAAVYEKALKMSPSARRDTTVGEVVNLMSVDAQRIMDLLPYVNTVWSAPLQISLALYFLWQQLGPSVLAGLAVLLVVLPVNGLIANRQKKLQIKQMKNKDQRVKLMNEILNGIKVLKLYAWEPSFEDQVAGVRGREIKVLRENAYLTAGVSIVWTCTPFLVSLASFMTYLVVSPDNVLDAKKIFVSITLLNLLRFPIVMLPIMVSSLVQAVVSLKRMNKFMNAEELDPQCVCRDNSESDPVVVENGSFAWGRDDQASLRDVNLRVGEGKLLAVVGNVGAGKSSLLSALLGEMDKLTGRVNVKGSVAYVPQQAWIQNVTLRDNITFNTGHDDARYKQVVQACALQPDIDMLPAGDQTEIGEKGINLSGGQKQRVSLARAVYSDAQVFLLDDPLSAVDAHVGKHIFEHVIGPNGLLKDKTRILVTHNLTYLPLMDNIVVVKQGRITEQGTYAHLMQTKGEFQEFLLQYLSESKEEEGTEELGELMQQLESTLGREVVEHTIRKKRESESDSILELEENKHKSKVVRRSSKRTSESEAGASKKENVASDEKKSGEKLIEAEKSETGKVSWDVYKYYAAAVGVGPTLISLVFYALFQVVGVMSNVWLAWWAEEPTTQDGTQDPATRDLYLGVYAGLGILQGVFTVVAEVKCLVGMVEAARKLHQRLLANVLRAPQSFFDTNPLGRILNRFSKDMDAVDVKLPEMVLDLLYCFFEVLSTFGVIIYTVPIFIVVLIPTLILYMAIQVFYVSTSRQLKRMESVSRSPIYSHFQESIQGAATIRAYGRVQDFISQSEQKVDANLVSYYPSVIVNRWLAIRVELLGNVLIFFTAFFAVLARDTMSPGIVGLSVSYALSVTAALNWMVRMLSDVETNVVAVERMKEYTDTAQEAAWELHTNRPRKDWPEEGVVEFCNYSTRYREGLELVLRDIKCTIAAGEKIGIVGRTGAGKSSLTLALFRLIEGSGGHIKIDGVDIAKIGLHDLRGRLTIIPQDPVLFSGSLRMNLDPFGSYDDAKVWLALEQAHLKAFVSSLPASLQHQVSEGGENLSVGQRQLVCLARALLRKTRVLVLDEATAAVDVETDALIQETIRKEFTDCTVLTIAHRLNTIMDSTRILVLDRGEITELDTPAALLTNKHSMFYSMAHDAGLA